MECSILTYPERGKWGDSSWRGNCSGYIYKDLFNITIPDYRTHKRSFVDPMQGSGTAIEVAQELGIEAYGLDLKDGFNILKTMIRERVGKEVDVCISHPPYHDMITYSGNVWGNKAIDGDLSRCKTIEEFYENMVKALINQRDAVKRGGWYGTIVGDLRRNGEYHSIQAELQTRMDKTEYKATIIKAQHNVMSNNNIYEMHGMPRIMHEYILLWQKKEPGIMIRIIDQNEERQNSTWNVLVEYAMRTFKEEVELKSIYGMIEKVAPDKLKNNPHWQAKVRQTLQKSKMVERTERGKYRYRDNEGR